MRTLRYVAAAIVSVACLSCGLAAAQEMQAAQEPAAPQGTTTEGWDRSQNAMDETSFLSRTPEEYRRDILLANNEAQIDAYVCQQIVQEAREKGINYSDDQFNEYLGTPEIKMERQKRCDYWMQERKNAKEKGLQVDYRKFAIGIGMIVVVLALIVLLSGKRRPKVEETEEKDEKKE